MQIKNQLGWKYCKNHKYKPTLADVLQRYLDVLEEQNRLLQKLINNK